MVKPGYKQTEIGVIPEDWGIKYLSDFGNVISGGTPSTSVKEYWDGDIAWCTPSDITATPGKYICKTNRNITNKGLKNCAATILPPNSVLLCTRATIGELKISKVPIATNQGFKSLYSNFSGNINYLYYLLQTKKKDMLELAIGSTFLEISKTALCSIPLQTPPLDEQERIAEALSDVDDLISSLEKLIEKYKSIKATCLQQMFPQNGETTPKMRLPGFTGAWEQRKLGDIAVRSSEISSESDLPRVEYEDIISGTGRLNKDIFAKESDKAGIVFHMGDVLYGKLRPYLQNWLLPSFDGLAVGDFWVLQPQNTDSSFLYMLIQSKQFNEVANQSTGTKMPRADWKLVSKTEFFVPNSTDEQAAIGAFFRALDNLATLHQRKLDKTKKIKQGMMQQLLTGKIRLV